MQPEAQDRQNFDATGRLWLRGILSPADIDKLGATTGPDDQPGKRVTGASGLAGALGPNSRLGQRLSRIFGPVFPTRLVSFAKSAKSNWGVGWHRDRIIAVRERHELPGFDNWSRKSGLWHCRPPAPILGGMLFCRLFLDDTSPANGGMEFELGSHQTGNKLGLGEVETENAHAGDVLVLHMNMLHRSKPAGNASPRRVIRVDFATQALPPPLAWPEWGQSQPESP